MILLHVFKIRVQLEGNRYGVSDWVSYHSLEFGNTLFDRHDKFLKFITSKQGTTKV